MAALEQTTTLDKAIDQQINLGFNDPVDIARKIENLYGQEWVLAQLGPYSEDFVAGMVRGRLSMIRNSALLHLSDRGTHRRRAGRVDERNFLEASKWVPGEDGGGWKKISELTPADCDAISKHYDKISAANAARAEFFRIVKNRMLATGSNTLGELVKHEPLPELEGGFAEIEA